MSSFATSFLDGHPFILLSAFILANTVQYQPEVDLLSNSPSVWAGKFWSAVGGIDTSTALHLRPKLGENSIIDPQTQQIAVYENLFFLML